MTTDDRLLTPEQAGKFLQFPVKTLASWRSRGDGPPFVKVGRSVRYRRAAVDAWLDAQTVVAS